MASKVDVSAPSAADGLTENKSARKTLPWSVVKNRVIATFHPATPYVVLVRCKKDKAIVLAYNSTDVPAIYRDVRCGVCNTLCATPTHDSETGKPLRKRR